MLRCRRILITLRHNIFPTGSPLFPLGRMCSTCEQGHHANNRSLAQSCIARCPRSHRAKLLLTPGRRLPSATNNPFLLGILALPPHAAYPSEASQTVKWSLHFTIPPEPKLWSFSNQNHRRRKVGMLSIKKNKESIFSY